MFEKTNLFVSRELDRRNSNARIETVGYLILLPFLYVSKSMLYSKVPDY